MGRPIPFTYIPPTGNECGRKPIAMYVISGHSWRCVQLGTVKWGTCTSSCGCAKNRKTGCERLPGWHRVSWVAWEPSNTVIFEREAVRTLQKNAPVFDVLAMETLPRDSASPEDCSHVGTLQVLVTALRSKRPSAWTLFTSWCCTCCGEKSMWRARRQNLLRGSCDPASSYTPTIPRRPS